LNKIDNLTGPIYLFGAEWKKLHTLPITGKGIYDIRMLAWLGSGILHQNSSVDESHPGQQLCSLGLNGKHAVSFLIFLQEALYLTFAFEVLAFRLLNDQINFAYH
jgi:hypothetical protein